MVYSFEELKDEIESGNERVSLWRKKKKVPFGLLNFECIPHILINF